MLAPQYLRCPRCGESDASKLLIAVPGAHGLTCTTCGLEYMPDAPDLTAMLEAVRALAARHTHGEPLRVVALVADALAAPEISGRRLEWTCNIIRVALESALAVGSNMAERDLT